MGKPAARIGDMHLCPMSDGPKPHVGGPIAGPCVPTVLIGGMPAAVMGDMCTCVSPAPDSIILGSTGVIIGGKPAARMGDMTAHGGTIVVGLPTVLIGEVIVSAMLEAFTSMLSQLAKKAFDEVGNFIGSLSAKLKLNVEFSVGAQIGLEIPFIGSVVVNAGSLKIFGAAKAWGLSELEGFKREGEIDYLGKESRFEISQELAGEIANVGLGASDSYLFQSGNLKEVSVSGTVGPVTYEHQSDMITGASADSVSYDECFQASLMLGIKICGSGSIESKN